MERDFDWSPFLSGPCDTIENSESDHVREANDFSNTVMNVDEGLLEEGEIQDEAAGESVIPATLDLDQEVKMLGAEKPLEVQQPVCDSQSPPLKELKNCIDKEAINDKYNQDAVANNPGVGNYQSPINTV